MFLGVDTSFLLDGGSGRYSQDVSYQSSANQIDDASEEFVSVVLAGTKEVGTDIFAAQLKRSYNPPQLVLFAGRSNSS